MRLNIFQFHPFPLKTAVSVNVIRRGSTVMTRNVSYNCMSDFLPSMAGGTTMNHHAAIAHFDIGYTLAPYLTLKT